MSPALPYRRRVAVFGATAAVAAAALLWWLARGEREIKAPPPNPFVRELSLRRMGDGTPIGETVEMPVNTGFLAKFGFKAGAEIPETWENRRVTEPNEWGLALVIYPRGSDREDEAALQEPCFVFPSSRRVRPGRPLPLAVSSPVPIGSPIVWSTSGFERPRASKALFADPPKKGEFRHWTYFAVGKDQPGEYIYELTLYPTAGWTSSVRFKVGPPVILRRGLLRVVAENG